MRKRRGARSARNAAASAAFQHAPATPSLVSTHRAFSKGPRFSAFQLTLCRWAHAQSRLERRFWAYPWTGAGKHHVSRPPCFLAEKPPGGARWRAESPRSGRADKPTEGRRAEMLG